MKNLSDEMIQACRRFLTHIPACHIPTEAFGYAAQCCQMEPQQICYAGERLKEHYDLAYAGIQMLLGAYIREAMDLFYTSNEPFCEVTVPSPQVLIMAFQEAAGNRLRFSTGAFAWQILKRSILLDHRPLGGADCGHRCCGLNTSRSVLFSSWPGRQSYLFQYNALCDECVKRMENILRFDHIFTVNLKHSDHPAYMKRSLEAHVQDVRNIPGISLNAEAEKRSISRYVRLQGLLARIKRLNSRADRRPLGGNSFALVQSIHLMVFHDWEPVIRSLEVLAAELMDAPPDDGLRRIYPFYTPFLIPEIDCRFRENGVRLMGNAAFLYEPHYNGYDLCSLSASQFSGMGVRQNPEQMCRLIVNEMEQIRCKTFLTGFFRCQLGALGPLCRRILLERYGISTWVLDEDFWCEDSSPFTSGERIDALCNMR